MFYTLLMHEVGHAIYSAPFNIAEENKFGADRFGIFNVLEDMRVEYQMPSGTLCKSSTCYAMLL